MISDLSPTALAGLPRRVTVYEVGPRDGLQNESQILDTELKAELIRRLFQAGFTRVEATSFVNPKSVPQLADAESVLKRLASSDLERVAALVPNQRGLDRALSCGVRHVAVFASATETFAQRNLNMSVDESIETFKPVVERALSEGLSVRGYLSMCFGDPWEGAVSAERVAVLAHRLFQLGCGELSIGDTIGVATPGQVVEVISAVLSVGVELQQLAMHFHDTYGQALANALASLQQGVTTIDASAGGLGGCPFARRATGNLASEDLLFQLNGLGIETGVDIRAVADASAWLVAELGRPSPSRVVGAILARGDQ